MKRRLFNVLAIVSLVLCVCLVIYRIFGKGHQVTATWTAYEQSGTGPLVLSASGSSTSTIYYIRLGAFRLSFLPAILWTLLVPALWLAWETAAFIRKLTKSGDSMVVPCATCGYDLRATPDRCPECGTMPKTAV